MRTLAQKQKQCMGSLWRHFNNSFVRMFVSEPGYYEDGAFGIRIENVLLVKPVELEVKMLFIK